MAHSRKATAADADKVPCKTHIGTHFSHESGKDACCSSHSAGLGSLLCGAVVWDFIFAPERSRRNERGATIYVAC